MTNIPNITDLLKDLQKNPSKSVSSFDDVFTLSACWDRQALIGDIDADVGITVENFIRFWNDYDNENNIPIEERKPIRLYIDPNGGDLTASFTMIDAIRLSKTPVYTINVGAAYSGGFFIFIAGHKRFAYPLSTFLYHEGSTGNIADAGKFRNFADFYDKELEMLKELTLKYTKFTPEFYEEKKRDDLWLTAQEALDLGVCDEILEEFI